MRSKTSSSFRKSYLELPPEVRKQARKAYRLFKDDPYHPSLKFKPIQGRKNVYSVRIGLKYRALGNETALDEITWFWIGIHDEYDTLLK